MSIMESKKKYDDTAIDSYLEQYNVYESSDLCIDIAAVIKYAREHSISLASVPPEIIEQHTIAPDQLVS